MVAPQTQTDDTTPLLDHKIVVSNRQECVFISVKDISHIEADGAYSNIFLSDGRKFVISKSVKVFSDKLPGQFFFRVHKSYIINLNLVAKYVKSEGGFLIMENGAAIPVSSNKKAIILKLVDQFSL